MHLAYLIARWWLATRKAHPVTTFRNGKVTCDWYQIPLRSCSCYSLDWYKSTNQHPNMWALARSSGGPNYPGDKTNASKRKRSRVTRPPVETHPTTYFGCEPYELTKCEAVLFTVKPICFIEWVSASYKPQLLNTTACVGPCLESAL